MVKPSDFFINILDFFAVLLPGAVLTGVFWQRIQPTVSDELQPFGNTALAVAFIVLSYVIGQLAYAAGSLLDGAYDSYRNRRSRKRYYYGQAAEVAAGDGLSKDAQREVNLFKWVEAQLRTRSPAAAADVDRAQAESKFFRTLSAVLIAAGAAGFLESNGTQLILAIALLPVVVNRFFKTRLEVTELAYRHYVVIRAIESPVSTTAEGQLRS